MKISFKNSQQSKNFKKRSISENFSLNSSIICKEYVIKIIGQTYYNAFLLWSKKLVPDFIVFEKKKINLASKILPTSPLATNCLWNFIFLLNYVRLLWTLRIWNKLENCGEQFGFQRRNGRGKLARSKCIILDYLIDCTYTVQDITLKL